jgi:hypothetical protein
MQPRCSNQRNRALTRTDVLAVLVISCLLAIYFLHALSATNSPRQHIFCISNLKQVGLAFRLWEGDNNNKYPMAVSVTNGGAMELVSTGNVSACFKAMSNELNTPKILLCPEDTRRTYATNFSTGFSGANISYFVNPDAVETHPQMILVGDDNLLVDGKPVQPGILNLRPGTAIAWTKDRHHGAANLGMADGSAQQVTTGGLQKALQQTGVATNRLAIP